MSPVSSESAHILKSILYVLSTEILDIYGDNNVTEEDIHNTAFDLRNNGKIPFFPRSIEQFETFSRDIYCSTEILISLGFLNQVDHQDTCGRVFSIGNRFRDEKDITKMLRGQQCIKSLAETLENEPRKYEKKICCAFFEFLKITDNFLFTHIASLSRKSASVDLKQVGIENFGILTESEPEKNMRKRGYEERILSKLGRSILSSCDDLFSYNLRVASLKKAYEEGENVGGKLVLINGFFEDDYCKTPTDFVYEFHDSIIFDHKIPVFFGERGKFYCRKSVLPDKECLLLGFVEPVSGEVALRAAGVVETGSKPGSVPACAMYPKRQSSRTEQPNISVSELNGKITPVLVKKPVEKSNNTEAPVHG